MHFSSAQCLLRQSERLCLNRKVFSLRLDIDPNILSVAVRLPNMDLDSRTITNAGSGHALSA